jgi:hypothetical protein
VTLLADLRACVQEHEYCGELDTGLEDDRVWMTCTCGARVMCVFPTEIEERTAR